MAFAPDDDTWTSRTAACHEMPTAWCSLEADGSIKLKDVAGGFYKNELVESTVYRYEFPVQTRGDRDTTVKRRLLADAEKQIEERAPVHIYRVAHGHDNYLGLWKVVRADFDRRPFVHLKRLAAQRADKGGATAKRSRSEARHEGVLRSLLEPLGMRIVFEPECSSGLRTPCVEGGKMSEWSSDFYTVDYVAFDVATCRMVFIESKCCKEDLDGVALKKCRRLRDVGFRRVVAVLGHAEELTFYDFATRTEEECFCDGAELAARLTPRRPET